MIRRSTIILILILLALVGFAIYLNRNEAKQGAAGTTSTPETVTYLFSAGDGLPTDIRVENKAGEIVEIARGADGTWGLTQPIEAKADQGLAEAAASQISTMRQINAIPGIEPDIVGLKIPEYMLTVKFTSGTQRKVEIGVVTPTNSGYYVRSEDGLVVIITKDSVDAILNLLTDPPYAGTPTPSPIPATETPLSPTRTMPTTPESAAATPTP